MSASVLQCTSCVSTHHHFLYQLYIALDVVTSRQRLYKKMYPVAVVGLHHQVTFLLFSQISTSTFSKLAGLPQN